MNQALNYTKNEKKTYVTHDNISVMFYWSLQSGNTTFLTYAWTCVTPWEKTRQVQAMGGQQIEHHWIRKSAATYIFFPCTRNMELIPCHLYLLFLDKSQIVFSRVFDNSELNLIKLSITEFENQQPCRRNIELISHHLCLLFWSNLVIFVKSKFIAFPKVFNDQ